MGGVKLWVPPPVVKFGCLMHDEQLSSSASRICRMVAVASIQIAFFVAPVPGPRRWLSMVLDVVHAGSGYTHADNTRFFMHVGIPDPRRVPAVV